MKVFFEKILVVMACMSFAACFSHSTYTPTVDKASVHGSTPAVHVARNNENLFLVAMKYDLDYQKLGRINGISYPYKLRPGQRVRLVAANTYQTVKKTRPIAKPRIPKEIEKPVTINKQKTVGGIKWQWPLQGALTRTFATAPEDYKGIDIRAKPDSNVRAAASGIVVYVGDGLEKYGNLVIISHKDICLSAYAQLKRIIVEEGQEVKIGKKIATSGTKDFHFEIRKDADAIDPQTLLP